MTNADYVKPRVLIPEVKILARIQEIAQEMLRLRGELLESPWIKTLDAITSEPDSVQRHHSYRALIVGMVLRKDFFSSVLQMAELPLEQRQSAFLEIEKNIKALESALKELKELAKKESYSDRKGFKLSLGENPLPLVHQVMSLDFQLVELVKSYPEEEQRLKVLAALESDVNVLKSHVDDLRTLANATDAPQLAKAFAALAKHEDFQGIEYVEQLLPELLSRLEQGQLAAIKPQDQIEAQSDSEIKMYLSSEISDHDLAPSVHEFLAYTAGQGSLATRIEMGAPNFLKAISSPTALASYSAMGIAGMGARALVTAKWGHLLSVGGRGAMAFRVAAPAADVVAEGTALTFSTAILESLFHSSTGQWDSLGSKTLKNILTLGALKGTQRGWSKWVGEPMANGRFGSRLGTPIEGTRGGAVVADTAGVLHQANPVGLAAGQVGQLTRLGERVNNLGNHMTGIGGMWGVEMAAGAVQGSELSPWDHLGHAVTGYVQSTIGYGVARAITGGRVHSALHDMVAKAEAAPATETLPTEVPADASVSATARPIDPRLAAREPSRPVRLFNRAMETLFSEGQAPVATGADALPTTILFSPQRGTYIVPEQLFIREAHAQGLSEFVEAQQSSSQGVRWTVAEGGLSVEFVAQQGAGVVARIPWTIEGQGTLVHNRPYSLGEGTTFSHGENRYVVELGVSGQLQVRSEGLSPFEQMLGGNVEGMAVEFTGSGGVRLEFEGGAKELPLLVNGQRLAPSKSYELKLGDRVSVEGGAVFRLSTPAETLAQELRNQMAELSPQEQASLAGALRRADPGRGFTTLMQHLLWYPGKGSEILRAFFKGAVEQRLPLEAYPEELGLRETAQKIFETEVSDLQRQGYLGENTPGSEILPVEQQFYLGYGIRMATAKVAAAKTFTELHDAVESLPPVLQTVGGVSRQVVLDALRVRSLEEKLQEAETKTEAESRTPEQTEQIEAMKAELSELQERNAQECDFPQTAGIGQRVADLQEAQRYQNERVNSGTPEGQAQKDLVVQLVQLQMMGRRARRKDKGDYNQAQQLLRTALDGLTSKGRQMILQGSDPKVGPALLEAYFGPEGSRELPTAYEAYRLATYMGQAGVVEPIQLRCIPQAEGLPLRAVLFRGENSSGWPLVQTLPPGRPVAELFPNASTLSQWISAAQAEVQSGGTNAAPHRQVAADGTITFSTSTVSPHGVVETVLTLNAQGQLQSMGLRYSLYPTSANSVELPQVLTQLQNLRVGQNQVEIKLEAIEHPHRFTPSVPMDFASPRDIEHATVAAWRVVNFFGSLFHDRGVSFRTSPDSTLAQGLSTAAGGEVIPELPTRGSSPSPQAAPTPDAASGGTSTVGGAPSSRPRADTQPTRPSPALPQ